MTDESLRADELVSAYLDGEATPAEIAEVEQDVALMARVEQLRAVRDAVAAPVPAVSEERRDQTISAALAVASEEAAQRREAKTVPIRRRRETLLAVAAAAMLVAAIVSAGLIASRGGDEAAETASGAPAAPDVAAGAAPATTAAAAEAGTAMADDSADYEMAEEEPMAEEADAALDAAMAATTAEELDEAAIAELEASLAEAEAAAAEAELPLEEPAEEAFDPGEAAADAAEADHEAEQVVDLGTVEDRESLFEDIAAIWSAALEDGATAASGACSAAVNERGFAVDVETGHSFIAAVGTEDPLALDGLFARRADGTAIIVYAASPGCEVGVHEVDRSNGS